MNRQDTLQQCFAILESMQNRNSQQLPANVQVNIKRYLESALRPIEDSLPLVEAIRNVFFAIPRLFNSPSRPYMINYTSWENIEDLIKACRSLNESGLLRNPIFIALFADDTFIQIDKMQEIIDNYLMLEARNLQTEATLSLLEANKASSMIRLHDAGLLVKAREIMGDELLVRLSDDALIQLNSMDYLTTEFYSTFQDSENARDVLVRLHKLDLLNQSNVQRLSESSILENDDQLLSLDLDIPDEVFTQAFLDGLFALTDDSDEISAYLDRHTVNNCDSPSEDDQEESSEPNKSEGRKLKRG